MDRKKTRKECVGAFNLISTDTELESKVCRRRALLFNPTRLFAALILIAYQHSLRDTTLQYDGSNSSLLLNFLSMKVHEK